MKKGRLIVIDGTDGVGKATQTRLLIKRLKKEGRKVVTLDFPQYEKNLFGKLVGECLVGEHGDFLKFSPYVASVLYAADRYESKAKIEKWLKEGKVVVLDRYVSANQIHQGGKIIDSKKRKEFLTWLDSMEHGVFKLPRPDVIVYLSLPVNISLRLLSEKTAQSKKKYLKNKTKDAHEGNMKHLLSAQKSALSIIKSKGKWQKIECADRKGILSREEIHEMVFNAVKKII